jgi:5'-nucleotidase
MPMEKSGPQNRRDFLKYFIGGAFVLSGFDNYAKILTAEKKIKKLTILYTNDQHSRIEPFPSNDPKYPDQGGFAKRASLIKEIRGQEKDVMLLDAGDIFQGTPYFNYYHGELEYKLMTEMGYDATTLGNHDFDLGMENIVKQMPHAGFSFINSNYDFSDTPLANKILPYKVFTKNGLTIGILGLGIELQGLVPSHLFGNIKYRSPVESANSTATHLRNNFKCDYIICLSHLGYSYDTNKVSDISLAAVTKNIDLIIGGHTHTFLEQPVSVKNSEGKEVIISQMGWAGIWLGRLDILFSNDNKKLHQTAAKQKI